MVTRSRKKLNVTTPYFARMAAEKGLPFVSSGCGLLDCGLGGGYVLGRVANIVGDKSTGKTLQTIETGINFLRQYDDGLLRYVEAESAFDDEYAAALGWPVERVDRPAPGEIRTVEAFFRDVKETIKRLDGRPCLYIIDSLDALSSEAELKRDFGEATYGQEKAKMMSEGFRKLIDDINTSRMLLLVVSQVRDNIGAMFGETKTRSGGKALDFYASQIIWLADLGKIKRTVNGIERVVGLKIKANIKKNKVGAAHRTAEYPIIFGYGIDDVQAGLEWLLANTGKAGHPLLDELRITKSGVTAACQRWRDQGGPEVAALRARIANDVAVLWNEIERSVLPKASKYG